MRKVLFVRKAATAVAALAAATVAIDVFVPLAVFL
jgi:hypothetical protein